MLNHCCKAELEEKVTIQRRNAILYALFGGCRRAGNRRQRYILMKNLFALPLSGSDKRSHQPLVRYTHCFMRSHDL